MKTKLFRTNDMNQPQRRLSISRTVLAAAFLISSAAYADGDGDGWNFGADIYLWGSNIDIETASGSNSEIRFTDIVEDLDFAGMGLLTARRDKFEFSLDIIYFDIDDNLDYPVLPGIVLNDLGIEAWVLTPTVGYRIQQSERSELYLIAGARYLWIDVYTKTDFSAPLPPGRTQSSVSVGSWDGVIGLRGQWNFTDRWYAGYYLDVGAGDSDSTFQVDGKVGYRFNAFDVAVGYRYTDWRDTENDALNDLNLSGFVVGMKFRF